MSTTENKNQVTLYRFVSLRSPELSKKEDQEKRFVFHPDNSTGAFFDAVENKPEGQTNWEAMKNLAFTAYQDVSEIEDLDVEFFKQSDWIARNRTNFNSDELYDSVNTLSPFAHNNPTDTEFLLWGNLFYQVVHQKSFYIKEALIQVLVLQNLLKKINGLDKADAVKLLPALANAKVVLPTNLFEEYISISGITEKMIEDDQIIISKDMLDAQMIEESKTKVENFESLIEDLKNLEKEYMVAYKNDYETELLTYQKNVAGIMKDYQATYNEELRLLCDNPRDEHYNPDDICYKPDVSNPSLPDFTFEVPREFDLSKIESQITRESYELLSKLIKGKTVNSFQEAIDLAINEIKKENDSISKKTICSEKTIAFGDTIISSVNRLSQNTELPFKICTTKLVNGNIAMYMTIQIPTSAYQVQNFIYHLHFDSGASSTNGYFEPSYNGNVLTLSKMYNNTTAESQYLDTVRMSGYINFTNGQKYIFEINPYSAVVDTCNSGKLVLSTNSTGDENTEDNTSFIPKGFGYKQLGIADYKKVVAEVCCYEPGEVAHIENVMASELRSKVTTKSTKSEITDFESTEVEKENMSDVVSTERFEMQTEVSKLLAEQKQISAYADIHTSWPNTTLDAGVAYASNTTREESNRQAVNQAKELTQRAVERIVSRVKKEKTVKITNEFIEENTHAFDNRGGSEHISGVFRFINAVYKNQVFNYGKRLMYEFAIPQPSKLHRLAMKASTNNENTVILEKPIDPSTLGITDFTKITFSNYQNLAAKYNASVEVCPERYGYINKTVAEIEKGGDEIIEGSAELQIDKNYKPISARLKFSARWDSDGSDNKTVNISFANYSLYAQGIQSNITQINLIGYQAEYDLDNFLDKISFSYGLLNYQSCNISLSIKTEIKTEIVETWRKNTYEAIIKGYQEQLRVYNEKLSEVKAVGVQMLDSNPLFYRQIEQMVLRKNCISYLLDNSATSNRRFGRKMYSGDSIINHQVDVNQSMDDYSSFAKFMEQAFEWNIMSYNFYPYYWGYNADWAELYQHESNDPIFRSFMQAGMARVVVTVKPGFEDAVMHYMATGQIWNGGQTPIIGDPLFLSIVDELREQEYTVEETWKTIVPTQLIALQRSGVALDVEGLPCDCPAVEEMNNKLIPNNKTLIPKP